LIPIDRVCSRCHEYTTYVNKHGYASWFRSIRPGEFYCKGCSREITKLGERYLLPNPMTVTAYNNTPRRSELFKAMISHIHYLVEVEGRPAYSKDFKEFKVGEITHKMKYGTIRNYLSLAIKDGHIKKYCQSFIASYTLEGVDICEGCKRDQAGGHSLGVKRKKTLFHIFKNIPMSKTSVHNLNFSFKVPHIWSLFYSTLSSLSPSIGPLSSTPTPSPTNTDTSSSTSSISILSPILSSFNITSKDIHLNTIDYEHLKLGIVIHHTDTVTVTIKCSFDPIPLNFTGITTLSNALITVKDRLSKWVEDAVSSIPSSSDTTQSLPIPIIPHYGNWLITMWHLNVDSARIKLDGEKFNIEHDDLKGVLFRVYIKEMRNGDTIIRKEKQENPNMLFDKLLESLK
jgi:hypothetical protein